MYLSIRNSFILHSDNIKDINEKNKEIRKVIDLVQDNSLYTLISKIAVEYYQTYLNGYSSKYDFVDFYNGYTFDESSKSLIWYIIEKEFAQTENLITIILTLKNKSSKHNIKNIFNLDASVYFKTLENGKTLYIFESENEIINEEFSKFSSKLQLESYDYQDSEEPDKDVTEEDWVNRKNDWYQIFANSFGSGKSRYMNLIDFPTPNRESNWHKMITYLPNDIELFTKRFESVMGDKFFIEERTAKGLLNNRKSIGLSVKLANQKVASMIADKSYLDYQEELKSTALTHDELIDKLFTDKIMINHNK